jgi:biopolymer transport protein ExbD
VARIGFIPPCGFFDEPVSHFRTALLTVTMTLSTVFLVLLLTYPHPIHKIMLDIGNPSATERLEVARPVHRVDIDADGSVTADGVRCADTLELRVRIDSFEQEDPTPEIRLRPTPNLRYESFIEVLAVLKKAHVTHLRVEFAPEPRKTTNGTARSSHCAQVLPLDVAPRGAEI